MRQAIIDANALAGADDIEFTIPGLGVHTIQPLRVLPAITETLSIKCFNQPGADFTTRTLLIEIDGTLAGASNGFSGNGLKPQRWFLASSSNSSSNTSSSTCAGSDACCRSPRGHDSPTDYHRAAQVWLALARAPQILFFGSFAPCSGSGLMRRERGISYAS